MELDFLRQAHNKWAIYHQLSGKMLAYHQDKSVLETMQVTWELLHIPTVILYMSHQTIGGALQDMREANKLRQRNYRLKKSQPEQQPQPQPEY